MPYKFGKEKETDLELFESGEWVVNPDSGYWTKKKNVSEEELLDLEVYTQNLMGITYGEENDDVVNLTPDNAPAPVPIVNARTVNRTPQAENLPGGKQRLAKRRYSRLAGGGIQVDPTVPKKPE